MGTRMSDININEFKRFTSESQDKLRPAIIQHDAEISIDSLFKDVKKSSGYLSEWSDDVVEIDVSIDRTKKQTIFYNLNEVYLQCKGELSIFSGIMPLVAFPNLTKSAKALLNLLDETFQGNTRKGSIITNNFYDVCRYFTFMIQAKGVYRMESLKRQDFTDFILEMKAKGGWANLLQLDKSLHLLLSEIKTGTISITEACSSRHNGGSYRVSIRRDFINRYTGIPGITGHIPRWFYDELLKFHEDKFSVNTGINSYFSSIVAYSHIKSINRLYDLPANFDKPNFRPFPDPIAVAYQLTGKEPNRLTAKRSDGRTANLSLEDALKLFTECIAWIYHYADGVLAILNLFRTNLEESELSRNRYRGVQKKLSNGSDLLSECAHLCRVHKLPFETVVFNAHSKDYDENLSPSLSDLVKNLLTACFIMIATNHGRRVNEIVGSNQLQYGLYFGCITPSREVEGLNFIDIYIEKTVKDYCTFYVNTLVFDSVQLLERISQTFRPLFTEPKTYNSDIYAARKDKLFVFREFTSKGFASEPSSYNFGLSSAFFFNKAGVVNPTLDNRTQPFRRFFALLYYYRYDMPDLLAVMDSLAQLDPGTTTVYLTDPGMRKSADRIEELFYSRIEEESRQVQEDMEDVRSEMFASTVMEILKGDRSGGIWPQMVLSVYKNLSEHAEFDEMDLRAQGKEVAREMANEGYHRVPFEHGGCNVGDNELTLSEARCKYDEEDFAHLEDASPQLCVDCPHHDCNQVNIQHLRCETARLLQIEEDFSQPLFLRMGSREQRLSLEHVIESELRVTQQNRKLLHSMIREFVKLAGGLKFLEDV